MSEFMYLIEVEQLHGMEGVYMHRGGREAGKAFRHAEEGYDRAWAKAHDIIDNLRRAHKEAPKPIEYKIEYNGGSLFEKTNIELEYWW